MADLDPTPAPTLLPATLAQAVEGELREARAAAAQAAAATTAATNQRDAAQQAAASAAAQQQKAAAAASALHAKLEAAEARCAQLAGEAKGLQARAEAAEGRVAALQRSLDAAQDQMQAAERAHVQRAAALELQAGEAAAEASAAWEETRRRLQGEAEQLQRQLGKAEGECAALRADLEAERRRGFWRRLFGGGGGGGGGTGTGGGGPRPGKPKLSQVAPEGPPEAPAPAVCSGGSAGAAS